MSRRILVPMDGSSLAELVMPWIRVLARAMEAQITLLRVLEASDTGGCRPPIDPLEWQMCKSEAESYLGLWAKDLQESGIDTEYIIQEGDAANRIIEFVKSRDVDLVVASSNGRSGLNGWIVGGVIRKIVSRSRISAMIVRAHGTKNEHSEGFRIRKVLVPLDGSKRSECVIAPVIKLAHMQEAQLILAHVVRSPETPRCCTPLSRDDMELSERITKRNTIEAAKYLDSLQARLSGDVQTRLLTGQDVASILHELARKENVDLVVLSAHGYSGNPRWIYGSVANTFIDYGEAPALIVQDFPTGKLELNVAEIAARESKGH